MKGEAVIHDWNFMLTWVGALKHAPIIASSIYLIGVLVFVLAAFFSLKNAKNDKLKTNRTFTK